MTRIVRGANLPASPHRDPNKDYVDDRSVGNLARLGLDAATVAVAKRGDEILDPTGSIPTDPPAADGRLTISELDRLDRPPNRAALFPDEQAAVPAVHRLFEVPGETHVQIVPVATLRYALERRLVEGAMTMLPIANLPHELQEFARRVQLVKNGDRDAATIERDDIRWAQEAANRGAFTAETHAGLTRIMARFHDDIYAEKVVGTLPPAVQRQTLFQDGGVQVSLASTITLSIAGRAGNNPPYRLTPLLQARSIAVEAPAGTKMFLKSTSQVAGRVGFFEAVVDGNGQTQRIDVPAELMSNNDHHLWIQVFDARAGLVTNARINVPVSQLENFVVPPETQGRKVDEWRDLNGQVIDHRPGISGYNNYPHLFAREQIVTS